MLAAWLRVFLAAGDASAATAVSAPAPGALSRFPPSALWKNTTLDWFRFTRDEDAPQNFRQRVLYYDKFWTSKSGPMLVFFGGEGACEDFYDNSGALFEMAEKLSAKVVFLEHRFYGLSLPFSASRVYGDRELRYLTVEQSLADMSDLLAHKSQLFGCAKSGCGAVLFGGSYGGMQAAWHRLKYPHLSKGAIAASAPVDIYPGEHKEQAFMDATLYTFRKYGSSQCANWIEKALMRINATVQEYPLLTSSFRTCDPVKTAADVARLSLYVKGAIATMAMVDYPFPSSFVTPMPAFPVNTSCTAVGPVQLDSDAWLFRSLNAVQNTFLNWTAQLKCHNTSAELLLPMPGTGEHAHVHAHVHAHAGAFVPSLGDITRPWNYMACSALILEPLTSDGDGFFVEDADQIADVERACRRVFAGVQPRPHWMQHAYGDGVQLASNLRNVLFSDGDKDPWRVGGMPSNSSAYSVDGSVLHLLIEGAAHHQDLRFGDPADSSELVKARSKELAAVAKWLGVAVNV